MRSFLSLAFFRPPKAILVPGMYFFGFSRYSNCEDGISRSREPQYEHCMTETYEGVLVPLDALLLVGVRVGEAVDGTGVATEKTVKVGSDLVALTLLQVVALLASGLEEVGTLLGVTCGTKLVMRSVRWLAV